MRRRNCDERICSLAISHRIDPTKLNGSGIVKIRAGDCNYFSGTLYPKA